MKQKPKRKHHKQVKRRQKQPSLTKATTDMTKLAVTGLVGSGIILSTGATLRNLTGK